ncbi:DUF6985 domain-containing protein [Asanoa siamensis]|uniref:DUF6985 domain-containing protein n=1 Tax=Asanoa siamensis TaxID=926357 RepID=A0ABQ4D0R9_9ACTN|nr:hypothetical protein [Asanoa siamensis]GIF77126.1 hypothetical protein Asi02nite_66440 [Asanoa siamensis]
MAAGPDIFACYQDVAAEGGDEGGFPSIAGPDEVWDYVDLAGEVTVRRDTDAAGPVCLSLECECDWEPEHGLQIVFREGRTVIKVGASDGHLTNASAYGRDDLRDLVYHPVG